MTKNTNAAAGAVSLKVLAERKTEGVNKSTQFKVNQRIINVVPGFNGRPIDPEHVKSIKAAKLAGAVFPPLFVNVDDGRIDLVDGEHRLTADLELIAEGHEIGPVDCMQFKGSNMDRIEHMIGSGSGSKPLTPLQLGVQYRNLLNMGRTVKAIADRTGKSSQHVNDMVKLAESNSDVQAMVTRGDVAATEALKVVKKHGSGAGKVLAEGLVTAKAAGKAKVTAKTIKPKEKGLTPAVLANAGKSIIVKVASNNQTAQAHMAAMFDSPSITPVVKDAIKTVLGAMNTPAAQIMSLVDAIRAEIESEGLVMAETSCPEHADLIVHLRASGQKSVDA